MHFLHHMLRYIRKNHFHKQLQEFSVYFFSLSEWASTILEWVASYLICLDFILSFLGACNLGAQIEDMYTYVWKKNLNSLWIMMTGNGYNSPEIPILF